MYFNESKYKQCINHLLAIKICIVLSYIIIFAILGAIVAAYFPTTEYNNYVIIIGICIGTLLGLFLSIFFTWGIDMRIQEAYWKIDVLNELKNQSLLFQKNTPVAKAIVSIENKQHPNK